MGNTCASKPRTMKTNSFQINQFSSNDPQILKKIMSQNQPSTAQTQGNQVSVDMLQIICTYAKDNFLQRVSEQNRSYITNILRLSNNQGKTDWIRQNVIGLNSIYTSPLGLKLQAIYVDHTATNRPFKTIQKMVEYTKLYVANPHTEYSQFGKFSTEMLHYSQTSLLKSFNADSHDFVVIPTGSGSTGAIKHYLWILRGQDIYKKLNKKLTVFITPYEHHSNILPWVQYIGKVEILAHNKQNTLIMEDIQKQLINYNSKNIIISVSAASNVTSKLTDLKRLNQIIKNIRANTGKKIIFGVDCAAFCCHHQLNVKQLDQIDLAYISPHKNLGGAESCGLLLLRKTQINNNPSFPGGGTVKFVSGYTKQNIKYQDDAFSKQVAGTPSFLGFYRAALSFELLKNSIGYDFIHQNQRKNTQHFVNQIKQVNNKLKNQRLNSYILTYGQQNLDKRANIVTFNIIDQNNKIIHYNFISLFLTDIFGIQVRSGCFCAGPYGIDLLQITNQKARQLQKQVNAGTVTNKPGYLRLDLTFYLKNFEIEYISNALYFICKYSNNLLKLYKISQTGHFVLNENFSKQNIHYQYQLQFAKNAESLIKHCSQNQLTKRQENLKKQLEQGRQLCENPQRFIK